MSILKNIREAYRRFFIRRELEKNIRHRRLLNFDQAQSFGIIYNATQEENYTLLTLLVKDLQQQQKKVKTLGFVEQKKMPAYCFPKLTFEFCNKKSFQWNYAPDADNVVNFISEPYDVLIDLTCCDLFFTKYLAAISGARFKLGVYDDRYVDVFDMMIQVDDKCKLKDLAENTLHYLKMINNAQGNAQ